MQYEGTVYRPPSEARSLIVQVTVGCAHNTCTFCTMYKDKKFKIRPLADILADFDEAAMLYGGHIRRIFLADGDALIVKTEMLIQILTYIWEKFPNLERVTAYGTTQDILHKSEEELMQLKAAGLTPDGLLEQMKPQAQKNIETRLVLEAIAAAEGITASEEEVEKEFANIAERYGLTVDKVKEIFADEETENIKSDIAAQKALDMITEAAVEVPVTEVEATVEDAE